MVLEKATEIGIHSIIPLICERTEKQKFNEERMTSKIISAMLQSQQFWQVQLHSPLKLKDLLKKDAYNQKFIAHCENGDKKNLATIAKKGESSIILIGPEGDFTEGEIEQATISGYKGVSLGDTRLRTETAGIIACSILRTINSIND